MQKVKFDFYKVYEKGREYQIVVFPFVEHMWVHEDGYEWEYLAIDGAVKGFKLLCYVFAILANEPDKIIYLPWKQEGAGRYYTRNYDTVLCRPELQFRRSCWVRIKERLDRIHWCGKYILRYDKKKLIDYYEKVLLHKFPAGISHYESRSYLPFYALQKERNFHKEEVLGDTAFFVLTRLECYNHHYHTVKDIEKIHGSEEENCWSSIGYMQSRTSIRNMFEEG